MTNDTRTPEEIERDITDERAEMSDAINDLQKKFSVDAIVGDIGNMFRGQGGDFGRAVSQTVGRNPAAVVLVGVGLAWLFIGKDRNRSVYQASGNTSAETWTDSSPIERDQYWYGNDQMAQARRAQSRGVYGAGKNAAPKDTAASGVMGTVHDAAHVVGNAVSSAANSLGNAASDLTDRLSHGLEGLSDDARSRVLTARRAAHEARQASGAVMKTGARAASNFFEDQPLVVGALAVALGAALGGVLPHSKIEDATMGNSSDQLFADAQALFVAERDKAVAAAKLAAEDVKGEIREAGTELAGLLPEGKSVGEVVVDRAADAATRVLDHATSNDARWQASRSES